MAGEARVRGLDRVDTLSGAVEVAGARTVVELDREVVDGVGADVAGAPFDAVRGARNDGGIAVR